MITSRTRPRVAGDRSETDLETELWVGFHVRLAATLAREGQHALALDHVAAARSMSMEATDRRLSELGCNDQPWASVGT